MNYLEAEDLTTGSGRLVISEALNCSFEAGTITSIIGPNGCGKSTLLKTLARILPAEKGKVTGYYSFATALTFFVGPLVSSFIIDDTAVSVLHVFEIDTGVTLLSLVIVIILMIRNRKFSM